MAVRIKLRPPWSCERPGSLCFIALYEAMADCKPACYGVNAAVKRDRMRMRHKLALTTHRPCPRVGMHVQVPCKCKCKIVNGAMCHGRHVVQDDSCKCYSLVILRGPSNACMESDNVTCFATMGCICFLSYQPMQQTAIW